MLDPSEVHHRQIADVRSHVAFKANLADVSLDHLGTHLEECAPCGGARFEAVQVRYEGNSGGFADAWKREGSEQGGGEECVQLGEFVGEERCYR